MKKFIVLFICFAAFLAEAQDGTNVVSTNVVPPVVYTNTEPVVSTNVLVVVVPTYVQSWPKHLVYDGSVWVNPTPEQCRRAGYELEANRPPPSAEEIAAAQVAAQLAAQIVASNAAIAQAEQDARNAEILAEYTAKTNRIRTYRDAYANGTGQLCALAGIPTARVLTMEQIQEAVMPLLSGPYAGMVNGILILLTNLEMKLTKEDGPNALDNI